MVTGHRTASDDAYEPLTIKEGWRRFVDHDPIPPEVLTPEQISAMDALDIEMHQVLRLNYHSQLVIVNTPIVSWVINAGYELMLVNRRQVAGARRGMVVFGQAGTGKTTAVTQLGRAFELRVRRRHPGGGPELPVVYLTVPPAATPRMLAMEFARFLGLPVRGRWNITDVTHAVCAVLADAGTQLVIVDEIHNLNLGTRSGAEASDQLKYFAERIPATFVCRDRCRAGRIVFRHARPPARQPIHPDPHDRVRLRHPGPACALASPDRHHGERPAPRGAPARGPGRTRPVSASTHRRHDR